MSSKKPFYDFTVSTPIEHFISKIENLVFKSRGRSHFLVTVKLVINDYDPSSHLSANSWKKKEMMQFLCSIAMPCFTIM